jgi:hypothetical protein
MIYLRRPSAVLLFVFAVMLFSAGCASYRVATTMEPPKGAVKLPPEVRFRIASVTVVAPTNVPAFGTSDFGIYQADSEAIREMLVTAGRKHYPWVFAETPQAIPLDVTITKKAHDMTVGGDACVSCLTLTIIPLRSKEKTDYEILIASDAESAEGLMALEFSREELSWMSLLPTGWIPVPGGRGERAWGTDSAWKKTGELMSKSCVDAIVKIIRRVDPAVWQAGPPVK